MLIFERAPGFEGQVVLVSWIVAFMGKEAVNRRFFARGAELCQSVAGSA